MLRNLLYHHVESKTAPINKNIIILEEVEGLGGGWTYHGRLSSDRDDEAEGRLKSFRCIRKR
jgi:hypothetical protein